VGKEAKSESGGRAISSQSGAGGGSWSWSCGTEGSIQNWTAPPCWRRNWPNIVAAEGQCSCCLVKTTAALTTLHKLSDFFHLTIATNLVDRKTNYYSQASHLVRPHQSFCLYNNTRIGHLRNNSKTFTKRLNFLCSWTWYFLLCFFAVLLTSPSLFSYPCPFSSATIVHPPNYSFGSFSFILSPCLSLPSYPPPTCHHSTGHLHTHHLLISPLYQLHTTAAPVIPDKNTLYYNNRNRPQHI
jgi:hypothetical protein